MAQAPDPAQLISSLSVADLPEFHAVSEDLEYNNIHDSQTLEANDASRASNESFHSRTDTLKTAGVRGRKSKWHFNCASVAVAPPPLPILRRHPVDLEGGDLGGASLGTRTDVNLDNAYEGDLGLPEGLELIATLPALSASASEETLRSFASRASVALKCVEFALRHTRSQNLALQVHNDKLGGTVVSLQRKVHLLSEMQGSNVRGGSKFVPQSEQIGELTRRCAVHHRAEKELIVKVNSQAEKYSHALKTAQSELDRSNQHLVQQKIAWEGRVRRAEEQAKEAIDTIARQRAERESAEEALASTDRDFKLQNADLVAANEQLALLKVRVNNSEENLRVERQNVESLSGNSLRLEQQLFRAETKLRDLVDENHRLLNGGSAPWKEINRDYQDALAKVKRDARQKEDNLMLELSRAKQELNALSRLKHKAEVRYDEESGKVVKSIIDVIMKESDTQTNAPEHTETTSTGSGTDTNWRALVQGPTAEAGVQVNTMYSQEQEAARRIYTLEQNIQRMRKMFQQQIFDIDQKHQGEIEDVKLQHGQEIKQLEANAQQAKMDHKMDTKAILEEKVKLIVELKELQALRIVQEKSRLSEVRLQAEAEAEAASETKIELAMKALSEEHGRAAAALIREKELLAEHSKQQILELELRLAEETQKLAELAAATQEKDQALGHLRSSHEAHVKELKDAHQSEISSVDSKLRRLEQRDNESINMEQHERLMDALRVSKIKEIGVSVAKAKAELRSEFKKRMQGLQTSYKDKIVTECQLLSTKLQAKHVEEVTALKKEMHGLKRELRQARSTSAVSAKVSSRRLQHAAKPLRRSFDPKFNTALALAHQAGDLGKNARLKRRLKEATSRLEKLEQLKNELIRNSNSKTSVKNLKNSHKEELKALEEQHNLQIEGFLMEREELRGNEMEIASLKMVHQKELVELKTSHVDSMIQLQEAFAFEQGKLVRASTTKYQKLMTEYNRVKGENDKVSEQLRQSVPNMEVARKSEMSLRHELRNAQSALISKDNENKRLKQSIDSMASRKDSSGASQADILTTPKRDGKAGSRSAAPTPGTGKMLYPELLSPEDTNKLLQNVLRRSLEHSKHKPDSPIQRSAPRMISEVDSVSGEVRRRGGKRLDFDPPAPTNKLASSTPVVSSPLKYQYKSSSSALLSFEERLRKLKLDLPTFDVADVSESDDSKSGAIAKGDTASEDDLGVGFQVQSIDTMALSRRISNRYSSDEGSSF